VTGGPSVLRIEGFKHSNLKTGAPNEREAHQPAAPTHARRHEHAPVRPRYATRVLSRYTHRVAISNSRLIAVNQRSVTFKVKDYRIAGPGRYKTMTLDVGEFIRRFLIHVLPKGLHRIRHYGLLASANRAETIARARQLLGLLGLLGLATPAAEAAVEIDPAAARPLPQPCPRCGGRMFVIETFEA